MIRVLVLFCLSFFYGHCWAQRYDGMRTYDIIGLANGEEISDCISKGLPFLVVGLIIFYICIKKSKLAIKENREEKGSWWGCISLILIGISIIIMLPLLAWVEAVTVSIISLLAIVAIIFLIWKWITK